MSQTATLPLARASRRLHLRQLALVPKPAPSAYYSTNRERIIAQGRAYYQAHRTEILARLAGQLCQNARQVHPARPAQPGPPTGQAGRMSWLGSVNLLLALVLMLIRPIISL